MSSSISSFRKHALAFTLGTVAMFSIIAGASEWLVRTKVMPEDSWGQHISIVRKTRSPYAAFGDSHVARNFDAAAPVVNLAYPSENIKKIHWKVDHYLDRVSEPKIVLLQADPHLFAAYRTNIGIDNYDRVFDGNAPLSVALSKYYRPQLIALWQVFFQKGGVIKSDIEVTEQGTLLSPGNLAQWPAAEVESFTAQRLQLHRPQDNFENMQAAQQYRDMVDAITKRGARVCLVTFPLAPVYRAGLETLDQADKVQYDKAIEFFQALASSPNVQFIDDRDRYDDATLFRDPDHLNKTGARLYGPILQNACFGLIEKDHPMPKIATVK